MERLKGKVAIITGGAGNLGSGSAALFVAEGARVVVADIREDRARATAEKIGPDAVGLYCNAEDPSSIETVVSETVRRFGRLDIMFNNAAITDKDVMAVDTTATEIPFDVWDRVMAVNVRGVLAGCRSAIPHMIAAGGGSIINTASGSGLAGDGMLIAYGTSKGAVIAMTRYVATQYGRQGIRCNAIAPGLVPGQNTGAHFIEALSRHVLTPRLGVPHDIAALAAFLASDDSAYITGQTICCDGGLLAHAPQWAEMGE
jgi:NAD(P)-dependent dehydrogenase (short-subunit alcohol dehydrogenase family)